MNNHINKLLKEVIVIGVVHISLYIPPPVGIVPLHELQFLLQTSNLALKMGILCVSNDAPQCNFLLWRSVPCHYRRVQEELKLFFQKKRVIGYANYIYNFVIRISSHNTKSKNAPTVYISCLSWIIFFNFFFSLAL